MEAALTWLCAPGAARGTIILQYHFINSIVCTKIFPLHVLYIDKLHFTFSRQLKRQEHETTIRRLFTTTLPYHTPQQWLSFHHKHSLWSGWSMFRRSQKLTKSHLCKILFTKWSLWNKVNNMAWIILRVRVYFEVTAISLLDRSNGVRVIPPHKN